MIVTDYDGNVVEFTGSKEDALNAGLNVDCIECRKCRSCSRCSRCSHCSRCSDCSHCSSCSSCSDCSHCSSCSSCSDCSYCPHCSYCSSCSHCSRCSSQPILNTPTQQWTICLRADHTMKIGCQDYDISEWLAFSDTDIASMASNALEFWTTWKPIIETVVKQFPNKVVETNNAN